MYSTHFFFLSQHFFVWICPVDNLLYSPGGEGSRRERESVPVSSGIITPQENRTEAREQSSDPICGKYRGVFQLYPRNMAISLTQENMFHHEQKKVNPSEYKTNVSRLLVFPKFIKNNNTTNRISNRHQRVCLFFRIFFLEEQCKPRTNK